MQAGWSDMRGTTCFSAAWHPICKPTPQCKGHRRGATQGLVQTLTRWV